MTRTATAAYKKVPTAQENTATSASSRRPVPTVGSRAAASTATDWLATTQMNHVPFAPVSAGRIEGLSTAVHGTM